MQNRFKTGLIACFFLLQATMVQGNQSLDAAVGFWKTVDSQKGFTTSVIAVYTVDDLLYGRIIISNDEKTGELIETFYNLGQRISKLKSNPYLLGVNLFWGLHRGTDRWTGGRVLDPRTGNTYSCQIWVDSNGLVLRGKVGPFGLNNRFYPTQDADFPPGFIKPDLSQMQPCIPIH